MDSATVPSLLKQELFPASMATTIMNVFVSWVTLRGMAAIPLKGPRSVLLDLLPATFMSTFMLTLITTLIIRRRLPQLSLPRLWVSRLPHHLLSRSATLAFLVTISVVPPLAIILLFSSPALWEWPWFLVSKVAFSFGLTLLTLLLCIPVVLAHDAGL